jgi:hypothetical protein
MYTIAVMINTRVLLKRGVEHINCHQQVLDKATEHRFSQRGRSHSGSVQTPPNQQSEGRDNDARSKQGPPPFGARISTGGRASWYCWGVERNK